jgi:hypothetical protein
MGVAKADNLYIGATYTNMTVLIDGGTSNEGGGSVEVSYLNGVQFEYLYCVDLFTTVYVPGSYPSTNVNTAGLIYGQPVYNADKVAWLLDNYGTAGQGDAAYALQAAIWHVVNDDGPGGRPDVTIAPSAPAGAISLYNSYLAALDGNTGNISDFLWITPGQLDSNGNVVATRDWSELLFPNLESHSRCPIGCWVVIVATNLSLSQYFERF